jgi:tRNA threonylcarbamoyladenosine biosynthesis protein TsaB
MQPTILALDTATEYCSAALLKDGQIYSLAEHCPNQHAAKLLQMIEDLLKQAHIKLNDVDAIALGCGPGSFTGVRIAVSIAQGLAYGLQKPLIPISTLNIMAQQAYEKYGVKHAQVALDARMQQIYYGQFALDTNALMQPEGEMSLLFLEEVIKSNIAKVGNGWGDDADYKDVIPLASSALPLALALFQQNNVVSPELIQPIYLRNNVAHVVASAASHKLRFRTHL